MAIKAHHILTGLAIFAIGVAAGTALTFAVMPDVKLMPMSASLKVTKPDQDTIKSLKGGRIGSFSVVLATYDNDREIMTVAADPSMKKYPMVFVTRNEEGEMDVSVGDPQGIIWNGEMKNGEVSYMMHSFRSPQGSLKTRVDLNADGVYDIISIPDGGKLDPRFIFNDESYRYRGEKGRFFILKEGAWRELEMHREGFTLKEE